MFDISTSVLYVVMLVFIIGIVLAAIARANHYRFNPSDIERTADGKVKWRWMVFVNVVAILIGGIVAIAAWLGLKAMGINEVSIEAVFISGVFAIAGDRIFIMAQEKLSKKAEDAF